MDTRVKTRFVARRGHRMARGGTPWTPYVSRVAATPIDERVQAPGDIYRLSLDMIDLQQEQLRVVLLDPGNRLLGIHLVYQGTVDSITVCLADLFREAIRVGATALALVHNHPTGRTDQPSPSDLLLTVEALRAGQLLGIAVIDHVIVAREAPGYFSILNMARGGPDVPAPPPTPA